MLISDKETLKSTKKWIKNIKEINFIFLDEIMEKYVLQNEI
jgi:hypothetical protein